MSPLVSECIKLVPTLRRFARVVLLNKVLADQLVKECLKQSLPTLNANNPSLLRKQLFQALLRCIAGNKIHLDENADLAQEALRNLLGKENRNDSRAQALVVALSQLSQSEREILLLAALEGFHYKDIGKMTGASLSTVMAKLHNGRELMRDILFGAVVL